MRLSFALFISGILVAQSDAAEPARSLQWQRRGNWRRRDGVAFNDTQSLPAQAAPEVTPSATPSSRAEPPPIVSSPPPFGRPPQGDDGPVVIPSGTGGRPVVIPIAVPLSTAGREEPAQAEPSAPPEGDRPSDPLPRPNLPNDNPVVTNTSSPPDAGNPEPKPDVADEPSNSSLGILFPTAGSQDAGATDPGVWNGTTTTTTEDSTITPAPFPKLNLTDGAGFNETGIKKNGSSCGGCVVNAQANVDWWFPANVFQNLASISTITLNGSSAYTAVPLSTWTNITEQLSMETFMYTEYMDPVASTMVEDYIFTTLPPPLAASTSITTISAIKPLPTTTFDVDELNDLNVYPDQPSIVVDPAVPAPISATQVDNIAWYTAYEVEFDQESTDDSGAVVCAKATSTYSLAEPYAYTLPWDVSFGDAAAATGTVDKGFLEYIPEASCTLGTWSAAPTMIVVVEVTIQRGFNVFLVHHEVSDPGALDTPTETLRQQVEQTTPGVSVVSAVGNVGGSSVTFAVTVTGNPASVTVPVGNSQVVASVVGGGNNNNPGQNNNQPATTNPQAVASAIISALGGGQNNNGGTGGNANPAPVDNGGSGVGSVNGIGFANPAPAGNGNTGAAAANPAPGAGSNAAAGSVPVITIGGQTFVGNQATEFSIAPGQTLTPGGVATVGSNTVSLAPNAGAIVINGQTSQLAVAAPQITQAPSINFQGQTIVANPAGAFVISGQSLVAGGAPITVGSNTIALGGDGRQLTVNGVAITAPPAIATPVIAIDGTTFQVQSGGQSFVIGGQTLTQGGQIVVGGNTISLSGAFAIVNGVSTVPLTAIFVPPTVNVAGTAFTQQQGFFVIQGTTIRPGQTSVIAGTTVAFGANGAFVVLNGVTTQLQVGQVSALVLGGTTYAATIGRAGFVIGGQTLTPGGLITANGHTISLSPNGVTLVVDGLTTLLTPITTLPPLITIGGVVYTANSGTTYNINGQILTPGACITTGGKRVCLAAGATALVVDGQTTKLFPATNRPNAVSAVATSSASTTRVNTPTGPSSSPVQQTASSTSRGAAPSTKPINYSLALFATLLSFFGALCAWM